MATVVVFSSKDRFYFERQGEDWKGSLISVGWFFFCFFCFLRCCVSLTQSNYDDKLSSRQKLANLTTYTVQKCLEKQHLGGPSLDIIITGSVFLTHTHSNSHMHSYFCRIFVEFFVPSNSALKPFWGSSTYHTLWEMILLFSAKSLRIFIFYRNFWAWRGSSMMYTFF